MRSEHLKYLYLENKIFQLYIISTFKCNLKCKGCHVFSNLQNNEMYDLQTFKRDINVLKSIGITPRTGLVFGGEPLLNKDCLDICDYFSQLYPNVDLGIATNGILLRNKEILKRANKYIILLSLYNTKYKDEILNLKINKIMHLPSYFDHYKNDYTTLNHENYLKVNNFVLPILNLHNPKTAYFNCCSLGMVMFKSKIYRCPTSANVKTLAKTFNLAIPIEDEYLKIDENLKYEDVINFLKTPCKFCKYCFQLDCNSKNNKKYEISWTTNPPEISDYVR